MLHITPAISNVNYTPNLILVLFFCTHVGFNFAFHTRILKHPLSNLEHFKLLKGALLHLSLCVYIVDQLHNN